MIDKFTFRIGLRNLQPGDIISVRSKAFSVGRATKRLIAVGGQRVQIAYCYVFVDGKPLTDNAFNHPGHPDPQRQCYYNTDNTGLTPPGAEIVVPAGYYFVLGDNSLVSMDSRFKEVGFIKQEDVIGRVYLRIWPPWRWGVP